MASASVSDRVYYCHICKRRTAPDFQDSTLTCPLCNQGFVEEVENSHQRERLPSNFMEVLLQAFHDRHVTLELDDSGNAPVSSNTRSRSFVNVRESPQINTIFQFFMSEELNALGLNGPAPARVSDINRLPKTKLTPSNLSEYDTCSICFDNYNVNDEIITLPCSHEFHSKCLTTWLGEHGTCPICRKDLDGRDTSRNSQDANPGDSSPGNLPDMFPSFFEH